MQIISTGPSYGIISANKEVYRVVKTLGDFTSEKEAVDSVSDLLTGMITEDDIIGKPNFDRSKAELLNILELALKSLESGANSQEAIKEVRRVLYKNGRDDI